MSAETLLRNLTDTARLYADFPPTFTQTETKQAVEVARRIGATKLLGLWDQYCEAKPGKPFRFFLEDRAAELSLPREAPTPKLCVCSVCGAEVPRGNYFFDHGTCLRCEKELCAPREESAEFLGTLYAKLLEHSAVKSTVRFGEVVTKQSRGMSA